MVESLEARQLMVANASDLLVSDLTSKSSNVATGAITAPLTYNTFNSAQVLQLSQGSLTESQSKTIDQLAQQSQLQLDASYEIESFQTSIPEGTEVQQLLLQSPFADELSFDDGTIATSENTTIDSNSVEASELMNSSFANTSVLGGLGDGITVSDGWTQINGVSSQNSQSDSTTGGDSSDSDTNGGEPHVGFG